MGEEFLSAVFTYPLTRLRLISEVRIEPRDRHDSKNLSNHFFVYRHSSVSIW